MQDDTQILEACHPEGASKMIAVVVNLWVYGERSISQCVSAHVLPACRPQQRFASADGHGLNSPLTPYGLWAIGV